MSDSEASYLKRVFVDNNLGVILDVDNAFGKGYSDFYTVYTNIKIKINDFISFDDISSSYIAELEKFDLSSEDLNNRKLKLKKTKENKDN